MHKVLFGAILLSSVFFWACGDSSSVAEADVESSESSISSEAEKSSSSQGGAVSSESQSGVESSGAGKSSSSVSAAKSSDSKSSSSEKVNNPESSSSSSEKVIPSSSQNQQSSSSVASSSSKAVSSSSWDITDVFYGPLWDQGVYKTFVDPRNMRMYYYLSIEGKDTNSVTRTINVMAENLNIGKMVPGAGDQNDDSVIERYCYDDDSAYCDKYGGLYQWAEMMQLPSECNKKSCADRITPNHQGICPDGWRLLTYNDFYTIVKSTNNEDGVKGIRSGFRFGGYNTTGYSLLGSGYNWNYSFDREDEATYWFYPEEHPSCGDICAVSDSQSFSETGFGRSRTLKTQGISVRCVMVE